jgi:hypothetical protein
MKKEIITTLIEKKSTNKTNYKKYKIFIKTRVGYFERFHN